MGLAWWVRAYRGAFGVLILVAVIYQAWYLNDHDRLNAGNYASFMTIQSNVLCALVLLWGASNDPERRDPALVDWIRGAITLYLVMVGIVVAVLLSGSQADLAVPIAWVDAVVHQWAPLVMLADWLIIPPRTRIPLRRAMLWLAYPLLYVIYSLIRGEIVDWYPYPFLNPEHTGGYWGVAGYCVAITLTYLAMTWLVVAVGTYLRNERAEPAVARAPAD
jgi:hypothetical protein